MERDHLQDLRHGENTNSDLLQKEIKRLREVVFEGASTMRIIVLAHESAATFDSKWQRCCS
jgi:hypothetical protein